MDRRLNEINARLIEYSSGKFDEHIKISGNYDEIDAISNGINMLGEELKDVMISKYYFNSIFNSVTEMVFILNKKGKIKDANRSAEEKLNYPEGSLTGKNIRTVYKGPVFHRNRTAGELSNEHPLSPDNQVLNSRDGAMIPVRVKLSGFEDACKEPLLILTATDITSEIKTENRIMRSIIDTQEKERQRFAKDLHDSLIQELSAIKFQINSALMRIRNKPIVSSLQQSNEMLSGVIRDVRNICFNLMPKILEEFGLVKAVKEFSRQFSNQTKFYIRQDSRLPKLSPELTIDLYRISQELITNAKKHGNSDKISILFTSGKKVLKMFFRDNGKGFDTAKRWKGMGLRNVQARVKSHNGNVIIDSKIGKGTLIKISIPIHNHLWLK